MELVGTVINQKYHITRVIGQGSFSIVYLAVYQSSQYAVKCLKKSSLSARQLAIQKQELSLLLDLNHPNITALVDHYESSTHLFLVMEYCELDLFDFILNCKFNTKFIFFQLLDSIIYLHSKGIYHRDLKPENVLIKSIKDPVLKLCDFGLSTVDQYSTEFGCGSVRYMAPECLVGKQSYHCGANDVWALAIILINLLTGKNPWVEPTLTDRHFKSHMKPTLGVDSFKNQFNFSEKFCKVLRAVFCPDFRHRPTALQFKEMLMGIDSFFEVPFSISDGLLTPPATNGFDFDSAQVEKIYIDQQQSRNSCMFEMDIDCE
jgi:serine/threonine protein kinase